MINFFPTEDVNKFVMFIRNGLNAPTLFGVQPLGCPSQETR
jgi:hypothetical protein